MSNSGIDVIVGPAALRVGKMWVGIASGNRYCRKVRKTSKKALKDAAKLELSLHPASGKEIVKGKEVGIVPILTGWKINAEGIKDGWSLYDSSGKNSILTPLTRRRNEQEISV